MLSRKLLISAMIVLIASCSTKTESVSLVPNRETKNEQDAAIKRINQEKEEKVVRFAYNSSKIDEDAIKYLDKKVVTWLKNESNLNVVIEGHCDERGSNKYNYNLGKKRAKSVLDYLASKGIAKSRMKAVSYGETKPLSLGHDEESWSINRRAVVITAK